MVSKNMQSDAELVVFLLDMQVILKSVCLSKHIMCASNVKKQHGEKYSVWY